MFYVNWRKYIYSFQFPEAVVISTSVSLSNIFSDIVFKCVQEYKIWQNVELGRMLM